MNLHLINRIRMIAIFVFAALAMTAGVSMALNRGSAARQVGAFPVPEEAAARFFEAYRKGDFESLDGFVYGCESLGFTGEAESYYGKAMLESARSRFKYEFPGEYTREGNHIFVPVEVEYFCVPDCSADLKEIFNERYLAALKDAPEDLDLQVHDDEYYDRIVAPSFESSINTLLEGDKTYMRRQSLRLEMVYDKPQWKIIPSDELKSILLGGVC